MCRETFYIDGVDARKFGICLQKPVEFSEAVPVIERQSIPGRNGDLIFDTGSYENRTGTAQCFCLKRNVEKEIGPAGSFFMGKKGYRRLETSDDPDHFWLARVENSPAIAQRIRTLAPFEISFDCKPQRFVKSGENKMFFSYSSVFLRVNIYNPFGFPARPLIHAHWGDSQETNSVGFTFIGQTESIVKEKSVYANGITENDLYIDCDIHDAYNENGNQNKNISLYEFPSLDPGENSFVVVGSENLEYVEITPRWWEL